MESRQVLVDLLGEKHPRIKEFATIAYTPPRLDRNTPDAVWQYHYQLGLEEAEQVLLSVLEERTGRREHSLRRYLLEGRTLVPPQQLQDVFIIHGHNVAIRESVARFLSKAGLNPIILNEQANIGRTLIEKLQQHSDVGFAIALMTEDDEGSQRNPPSEVRMRARQNVLFEFGYFVGVLGRNRTCALVQGNVEIPSDLTGIVYIPIDPADGWQMQLLRELKYAGMSVKPDAVI